MPSTHLSLHYHLIFSTKNRLPLISKDWRANLHAYLGGIVKGINGIPLAIGGIEDHAHLLIGLRALTVWTMCCVTSKPTLQVGYIRRLGKESLNGSQVISVSPSVLHK